MDKELGTNRVQSIKIFRDIDARKEAHKLALVIYDVTRAFSQNEMFCLISQIRRAVVSVTSNIAEGFCRQSCREKVRFYSMALGSVAEVQSQITIARDVGCLSNPQFQNIDLQAVKVHKIINGLIKGAKRIYSGA